MSLAFDLLTTDRIIIVSSWTDWSEGTVIPFPPVEDAGHVKTHQSIWQLSPMQLLLVYRISMLISVS
jgi:hypothetical protein